MRAIVGVGAGFIASIHTMAHRGDATSFIRAKTQTEDKTTSSEKDEDEDLGTSAGEGRQLDPGTILCRLVEVNGTGMIAVDSAS